MTLNLPVLEELAGCKSILIAGMGGGFDVFCGLPIYLELRRLGQTVHLGSLSFSSHVQRVKGGIPLTPGLVGVTAAHTGVVIYFPELYLAQWLAERYGESEPVWCFLKSGVQPMLASYRALVAHLSLDAIVLVDGGVDSLARGDEATLGTVIDDAITLAAVSELQGVPVRLLACLGFGTEREVTHAHILENIAALTAAGGFRGCCSLAPGMDAYREYEAAMAYAHSRPFQDPSVINSSVISAVQGYHGNYHATEKTKKGELYISPLMPIYWFFDLVAVAERNLFLSQILWTETAREALFTLHSVRHGLRTRPPTHVPLP